MFVYFFLYTDSSTVANIYNDRKNHRVFLQINCLILKDGAGRKNGRYVYFFLKYFSIFPGLFSFFFFFLTNCINLQSIVFFTYILYKFNNILRDRKQINLKNYPGPIIYEISAIKTQILMFESFTNRETRVSMILS